MSPRDIDINSDSSDHVALPRRSVLGAAGGALLAGCISPQNGKTPSPVSPTATGNSDPVEAGTELFVSPDGDDGNEGSESAPLASLSGARDAIRAMDSLPEDGVAVTFQEGTYRQTTSLRLSEEDSGTESSPVVYRSAQDATVEITGGVQVNGAEFTTNLPDDVAERLADDVRDEIVALDLAAVGIDDYGELKGRGGSQVAKKTYPVELFANGQRQTLARYPNEGYVFNDEGWRWSPHNEVPINYSDERPETWQSIDDVWILIQGRAYWNFNTVSIASIDPDINQFVTGPEPVEHGVWDDRPFFYFNVLEEIDEPGEYYIDRDDGMLYWYPATDPEDVTIELSTLESPIVRMKDTNHVRFRDITFKTGRGRGIRLTGGENNDFIGCEFRQFGLEGVRIEETESSSPARNNRVLGCDVFEMASKGLHIDAGSFVELSHGKNVIQNTEVGHYGQIEIGSTGIALHGVGNMVTQNYIHDAPREGIDFGGISHRIENNHVARVVNNMGDSGAIHSVQYDEWNNQIIGNYVHDIRDDVQLGMGGAGPNFQAGLYWDNFSSGNVGKQNVFINCHQGHHSNGSRASLITQNLYAFCDIGIRMNAGGWVDCEKGDIRNRFTQKRGGEDIDLEGDPWKSTFPDFQAMITDSEPCRNVDVQIRQNAFFRTLDTLNFDDPLRSDDNTIESNLTELETLGLVDGDNLSFELQSSSPITQQIPDWNALDIATVGLQRDPSIRRREDYTPSPSKTSSFAYAEIDDLDPVPVGDSQPVSVKGWSLSGEEITTLETSMHVWDNDIASISGGNVAGEAFGQSVLDVDITHQGKTINRQQVISVQPELNDIENFSVFRAPGTLGQVSESEDGYSIISDGNMAEGTFTGIYKSQVPTDGQTLTLQVADHTGMEYRPGETLSGAGLVLANDITNVAQANSGAVAFRVRRPAATYYNSEAMLYYATSDGWEKGPSLNIETEPPYWQRLTRNGDTVTAWIKLSASGEWQKVGSVTVAGIANMQDAGMWSDSGSVAEYYEADLAAFNLFAPSDVETTLNPNGDVELTWGENQAVESYAIARSVDPTGPFETIATDVTGGSYTDSSVETYGPVYYTITVKAAGITEVSQPIRVNTNPPPTDIEVAYTDGAVELSWSGVESASSYHVVRKTEVDGEYETAATNVTGTSFRDTTADSNTYYFYSLRSVHKDSEAVGLAQEPAVPVLTHPEIRTFQATDADFDMSGENGFILDANGRDVWSYADEYAGFYRPDGLPEQAVAETTVLSQEAVSDHVKTGFWVKNDFTKPGESLGYLDFFVTPGDGVKFQLDTNENGFIDSTGPILMEDDEVVQIEYPAGLRLEKDGTTFTGYYKPPDGDWIEIGTVDVPTAEATQDVALASTSHRQDRKRARVELEGFDVE